MKFTKLLIYWITLYVLLCLGLILLTKMNFLLVFFRNFNKVLILNNSFWLLNKLKLVYLCKFLDLFVHKFMFCNFVSCIRNKVFNNNIIIIDGIDCHLPSYPPRRKIKYDVRCAFRCNSIWESFQMEDLCIWLSWSSTTNIQRQTWHKGLGFRPTSIRRHLTSSHYQEISLQKFHVKPKVTGQTASSTTN